MFNILGEYFLHKVGNNHSQGIFYAFYLKCHVSINFLYIDEKRAPKALGDRLCDTCVCTSSDLHVHSFRMVFP